MPKQPRQTKTPRQRAEEALAAADRKVTKLRKQSDQLRVDLSKVDAELRDANALRDFLAGHPALPKSTQQPTSKAAAGDQKGHTA